MSIKQLIRHAVRALGYDFRRIATSENNVVGQDPWDDMATFLTSRRPVIFDIGANTGQTVKTIHSKFADTIIHSFEPSASTFQSLKASCSGMSGVNLWNCALGAQRGHQTLLENFRSDMSSFLPLGRSGWGEVVGESIVSVDTVDEFCAAHRIDHIDILKSDTQGYDYEVLKGSDGMIRMSKISLVYIEVIFSDIYQGVTSFGEVFDFLSGHGFKLVSFYDLWHHQRLASSADALFVHESAIPAQLFSRLS